VRCHCIDSRLGLGCVGQIDAAKFDAVGRCRGLPCYAVNSRNARASRQCSCRDDLAERA
jgi:hypothetical protein